MHSLCHLVATTNKLLFTVTTKYVFYLLYSFPIIYYILPFSPPPSSLPLPPLSFSPLPSLLFLSLYRGFSIRSFDKEYNFKPCSVQSMWYVQLTCPCIIDCNKLSSFSFQRTVLQSMYKAIEQARTHNYFVGGLSHTWMTYYKAQLTDDGIKLNEW